MDFEKLIKIYTKKYISTTEVGVLLGVSFKTAQRRIDLHNEHASSKHQILKNEFNLYDTDVVIREFDLGNTFNRVKLLQSIYAEIETKLLLSKGDNSSLDFLFLVIVIILIMSL